VLTSPNVAVETLYNWAPQTVEVPNERAKLVYAPTPGLTVYALLDDGPVRGGFYQDGRSFCVSGLGVYEFFTNGPPIKRGMVSAKDANPVTFSSNGNAGHQLYITSAGRGNIYDLNANTVAPITAPGYPAATPMGAYLDTYFLTIQGGSAQFNISAIEDGTQWAALDFSIRVGGSDNLVGIIENNKIILLFGTKTTEAWYDAGAGTFPFQSVPQTILEMGCVAPYSIAKTSGAAGAVVWLHQTSRGRGIFVMQSGGSYGTQRISTYAQEQEWLKYPTFSDVVTFTYTEGGHDFAVVTFPSGNATWVYDFGEHLWHRRGWLNPTTGLQDRRREWVHWLSPSGQHLVGDWEVGTVYVLDQTVGTDNGQPIQRQRRAPHLVTELTTNFYSDFRLDMETGLGATTGQGSAPLVLLNWSDDGGHTWSDALELDAGSLGKYRLRCRAAGTLGSSRDRVFQVTVSDPIPWRVNEAYVNVIQGTS
jgi:hypothetical protein